MTMRPLALYVDGLISAMAKSLVKFAFGVLVELGVLLRRTSPMEIAERAADVEVAVATVDGLDGQLAGKW